MGKNDVGGIKVKNEWVHATNWDCVILDEYHYGAWRENAKDLFETGFDSVCLINSDSPTVPASVFAEAANELARDGDRIVLGPSDDGGYYLIGLKQHHARVFQEIDWSTERVLRQTLDRAVEIGVKTHRLPSGYDVDDRATLRRLCEELLGDDTRSTNDLAPNTRKFLADIVEREGRDRIWPR